MTRGSAQSARASFRARTCSLGRVAPSRAGPGARPATTTGSAWRASVAHSQLLCGEQTVGARLTDQEGPQPAPSVVAIYWTRSTAVQTTRRVAAGRGQDSSGDQAHLTAVAASSALRLGSGPEEHQTRRESESTHAPSSQSRSRTNDSGSPNVAVMPRRAHRLCRGSDN